MIKIQPPTIMPPPEIKEDEFDWVELWNKYMDFCKGIGFDIAVAFLLSLIAYLIILYPSIRFLGADDWTAHSAGVLFAFIAFIGIIVIIGRRRGWFKKMQAEVK